MAEEVKNIEQTPGRVHQLPGARYYFKPNANMLVIRKSGVTRTSDKVREINEMLEEAAARGEAPATVCKRELDQKGITTPGARWRAFRACLRRQMKKVVHKV